MSAHTVENKVLSLFKAMQHMVKAFEDQQTVLDSLRVDYSCAGGSCEVCFTYLAAEEVVIDHQIVRYVPRSELRLPSQIEDLESQLRDSACELLYSIHGSSCYYEAGSSGYFHTRSPSSLITGEHIQSEQDEDGQYESSSQQTYVFCIKPDPLEGDWEVVEVQVSRI